MAVNKEDKKKARFQVEFEESQLRELRELQELGGASNKDLLNNAIAFLHWAAEETQKGNSIASVSEDGEIQYKITSPFLRSIAAKVAKGLKPFPRVVNE